MQPLNKKERRVAFFQFLITFLACLGLVTIVVIISVNIPFYQVLTLQDQVNEYENKDFTIKRMSILVDSLSSKMKRYERASYPILMEKEITNEIYSLQNLDRSNDADFKKLTNNLTQTYLTWLGDKKNLSSAGSASGQLEDLRKQIKDLKDDNRNLEIQNLALRNR